MTGTLESIASFKAKRENKVGVLSETEGKETQQLEALRQAILRKFLVNLKDPKNIMGVLEELKSQGKDKEYAELINARVTWLKYKTKR